MTSKTMRNKRPGKRMAGGGENVVPQDDAA